MTAGTFWDIQFKDVINILILIVTIAAIYIGPIRAVQISRKNQEEDAKRAQRYGVLHSLIKTRKVQLSPEHVMALNLVQLEFYGDERVQNFYKAYINILNGVWPKYTAAEDWQRHNEAREDALYDLIHEIARVLGYTMDRQELKRLGYGPQGWETDENQWRMLRHFLIETLDGKRGLPVLDFAKRTTFEGKFPPRPA